MTVVSNPRCLACKHEIEPGATKCVHCESFQNWKRHLQFSSTVLSLLIALFSVAGLTIPVLVKTFQSEKAEVKVQILKAVIRPRHSIADFDQGKRRYTDLVKKAINFN